MDGRLDLCAVKHFRLPEPLRVVLDLLLGERHQTPILAFAHDVKDTGNDVATHPAVPFQTDQLALLVAENAVTISDADDLNESLVVGSDANGLLQRIQIIIQHRHHRMLPRLDHEGLDFLFDHVNVLLIVGSRRGLLLEYIFIDQKGSFSFRFVVQLINPRFSESCTTLTRRFSLRFRRKCYILLAHPVTKKEGTFSVNTKKQTLLTSILASVLVIALGFYLFFLNEWFAQLICIVSAVLIGAFTLIQITENESFKMIFEFVVAVAGSAVVGLFSSFPIMDEITASLNRFLALFSAQLGNENPWVLGESWMLIAYWGAVWLVYSIYTRVQRLHIQVNAPELKERDYYAQRNNFCKELAQRIDRVNKATDWSVSTFTPIDAEVEAEARGKHKKHFDDLHKSVNYYRKRNAVMLVLSDPGSGKSVAMRKLTLNLLKDAEKTGVVPVYVDLKKWDVPFTSTRKPGLDDLLKFVKSVLRESGDSVTDAFLDKYFNLMLDNGLWYFIFDSFDELPCLMGREANDELIGHLSNLLNTFLLIRCQHGGVIASRLFRSPSESLNANVTLRLQPFNDYKIRTMLRKHAVLSKELEHNLFFKRDDLVAVCRNPFYLSLLINYLRQQNGDNLPDNQMGLYQSFVEDRLRRCTTRILEEGLTIQQVLNAAKDLAIHMQNTSNKGLERKADDLPVRKDGLPWKKLLSMLAYARLCRYGGENYTVSFAHRRFQEYFVVQDICEQGSQIVSEEYISITNNSGMRDALVLYCEVAPEEAVQEIAAYCWEVVQQLIESRSSISNPGSVELVNTLYFMAEAFRNRRSVMNTFLKSFQNLLMETISSKTDFVVQHAMSECMVLFSQKQLQSYILRILSLGNSILSEVVLMNCRAIRAKLNYQVNSEIADFFLKLPTRKFLLRFRNTDYSLSLSPKLRYIRIVNTLRLAAEIGILGIIATTVTFAIYSNVFKYYCYAPLPPISVLVLVGMYWITVSTFPNFSLDSPLELAETFIVMFSYLLLMITGYDIKYMLVLVILGFPAFLAQAVPYGYTLWMFIKTGQFRQGTALLFSDLMNWTFWGLIITFSHVQWNHPVLWGIAVILVLFFVLFYVIVTVKFLLRPGFWYLHNILWLKKERTDVSNISCKKLEDNLKKLHSPRVARLYIDTLLRNGVKLTGTWSKNARPKTGDEQVDLLLARLECLDKKHLRKNI